MESVKRTSDPHATAGKFNYYKIDNFARLLKTLKVNSATLLKSQTRQLYSLF